MFCGPLAELRRPRTVRMAPDLGEDSDEDNEDAIPAASTSASAVADAPKTGNGIKWRKTIAVSDVDGRAFDILLR